MPKVFIIILNWNNWSDTLSCLESLQSNDYPNYQVVIIDNGSDEKFKVPAKGEARSRRQSSKLKVIYNKENLGFAGGNNVGIKYALEKGADYVLLLNDDTIVASDFLSKLVETGESNEKFGLIGSMIYYYVEPKRIWFAGGKISPFSIKGTHIGLNQVDNGQYQKIKKVDYITGCCLLIKKEVINKIGLMPDDYFLYYEDADWSWQARKAGYKCILVPQSKIWHKCSVSAVEGSPSYIYYHSRNGLLLVQRNGSFLMRFIVYLRSIWILAKQIIKIVFFPKKRIWGRQVILGIQDFYLRRYGKYENWH